MAKEIELSQALSAKICHDLAGAIGTIDNCLNLLENENNAIRDKARELVYSESENLVNRIRFFRSAYGINDGDSKMSIVGITKLLKDFLQSTDIFFKIDLADGILYIDSLLAKCFISLASIAADNVAGKGEVKVNVTGDNDNANIEILSSGKNLTLNEEGFKILSTNARCKVNVKNCREHYIKSILTKLDYKISVNMESNIIKYYITRAK